MRAEKQKEETEYPAFYSPVQSLFSIQRKPMPKNATRTTLYRLIAWPCLPSRCKSNLCSCSLCFFSQSTLSCRRKFHHMKEAQGFLFNVFMSQGQEIFLNIQTHSEKSKLYHSGLVLKARDCVWKTKETTFWWFLGFLQDRNEGN